METAMGERVLWRERGREKRQGTREKQQQETALAVKLSASPTEADRGTKMCFSPFCYSVMRAEHRREKKKGTS